MTLHHSPRRVMGNARRAAIIILCDRIRDVLDRAETALAQPGYGTSPRGFALRHQIAEALARDLRQDGAVIDLSATPARMRLLGISTTSAVGGLSLFSAWLARARAEIARSPEPLP